MRFDDDARLDATNDLAALLREQDVSDDEIAGMLGALQRLPDWHAPAPTQAMRHALLAKLSAQQSQQTQRAAIARHSPVVTPHRLSWGMQLALRQPRLIHRSLWAGATVGVFLAACLALLRWSFFGLTRPGTALEFFLPAIAAASMAFIYGPESDAGLEVTQATPVSPRAIATCRLVMLGGYEVLLGLAATGVVAYTQHLGFGGLAALWLGPMTLFSACSLLLSLLIGPIIAAGGLCAAWLAQFVQLTPISGGASPAPPAWLSQPPAFVLAAVVLVVALLYLPRHERGITI